jgi:hypothetical protein
MARRWFTPGDSSFLLPDDYGVLNRAMRRLVDLHDVKPLHRNLTLVREVYRQGMTADGLIAAVLAAVREREKLMEWVE